MEWEMASGQKRRRRPARADGISSGSGGGSGASLAQLAQQLKAAMMPKPRSAPGGTLQNQQPRKPEWTCSCGTTNFMDRKCCRRCAARPGHSQPVPPQTNRAAQNGRNLVGAPKLPPGSAWASAGELKAGKSPQTSAAKASALEQALAAAKSAGASQDAMAALEAEAASIHQQVADTRPLGARLDSARAKVNRAASKVASAEESIQAALELQQQALAQQAEAQAELNGLLAQMPGDAEPAVMQGARALLQDLEHSSIVASGTSSPPEKVLDAMLALQQALGELTEEEVPAMELDPGHAAEVDTTSGSEDVEQVPTGRGSVEAPSLASTALHVAESSRSAAQLPADGLMDQLRNLRDASSDDASSGAAVRQALARRGPY